MGKEPVVFVGSYSSVRRECVPLTQSTFSMAASHFLKQALLFRACFHNCKHLAVKAVAARPRLWCSAAITPPSEKPNGNKLDYVNNTLNLRRGDYSSSSVRLEDEPEYRKWKDKEDEILNDIEPILLLTKEILHSPR